MKMRDITTDGYYWYWDASEIWAIVEVYEGFAHWGDGSGSRISSDDREVIVPIQPPNENPS